MNKRNLSKPIGSLSNLMEGIGKANLSLQK